MRIRRLTSAPKPSWRVLVYIDSRVVALDAQAVAHPVEAGEVGARLGRGQDVVGAQRVRGVREAAGLHDRSELLGRLQRRLEGGEHARLDAVSGQLLRHADADAVETLGRRQRDLAVGVRQRGRVHRIGRAGHVPVEQRAVGHVAGERAGLVERRGEGDHPVARDPCRTSASGRRCRTGPRAGGSSRPCRCPGPKARGRRPPRPARCRRWTRRERACDPPRVEHSAHRPSFSFDEPMANSSWLVLPSSGAPAAASRLTTVAV